MGDPGRAVLIVDDPVHEQLLRHVADELSAGGIRVFRGRLDSLAATQKHALAVVVTTIRQPFGEPEFAELPSLRGLVVPTTGIESIDLDAANRRGLKVANGATDSNVISMAEAHVLLILAGLYRYASVLDAMRTGNTVPPFSGSMLRGRTIGLVGWGNIASALADRLLSFQVSLLASSRYPSRPDSRVDFVSLDTLLANSDVVCLTAALRPGTHHLLGSRELARMKPGSLLINAARGALVEEAALIEALRHGPLIAALLDTFENEPLPLDHPLRTLPNAHLTPHCIGHTKETLQALKSAAVANVRAIMQGAAPRHWVNRPPATTAAAIAREPTRPTESTPPDDER